MKYLIENNCKENNLSGKNGIP